MPRLRLLSPELLKPGVTPTNEATDLGLLNALKSILCKMPAYLFIYKIIILIL